MKILNLYAGLGGNRTLWKNVEVTAVEKDFKRAQIYHKRFPKDRVHVLEAEKYLRYKEHDIESFDVIWASPPCQSHSQMMKFYRSKKYRIPIPRTDEIYGLMHWLKRNYRGKYIIENVQPYYKAPVKPTARIERHCFWTNFEVDKITTAKGKAKHGKIGGIMRTEKEQLIEERSLEDIATIITEQEIRNTMKPWIGKHLLEQARKRTTLKDYYKSK